MAILRVNQIDPAHANAAAGWTEGQGAIDATPPAHLHAYELRIVGDGTNGDEAHLRARVRQLLIETTAALAAVDHAIVVRLDGPLTEVAAAIAWGLDKPLALSPVRRFDGDVSGPIVSFRASGPSDSLASLCDAVGPAVGRAVRLRAFAVPVHLIAPLLDIDELDDERWPDIFAAASLVVDTIAHLGGVTLLTPRGADDLTAVLSQRLAR